MLDECKGAKFEEVIRVFAMAVLRKEACQKFGTESKLIAGYSDALKTPEKLTAEQRERLLPLLLAHKQVLQNQLDERQRHSERFREEELRLNDAKTKLAERRNASLAREGQLPSITPQEIESVSDHVRAAWAGNLQWAETLISAGPTDVHDALFDNSLRPDFGITEPHSSVSSTKSLLADLNARIEKQESRLQKWSEFRTILEKSQKETFPKEKNSKATVQTREPILRFDAHQRLQLRQGNHKPTASCTKEGESQSNFSQIVEEMRTELARLKGAHFRQTSPQEPDDQVNRPENVQQNYTKEETTEDARPLSYQAINHRAVIGLEDSRHVRPTSTLTDTLSEPDNDMDEEVQSPKFTLSNTAHGTNPSLDRLLGRNASPESRTLPEHESLPVSDTSLSKVPKAPELSQKKYQVKPQVPYLDVNSVPSSPPLRPWLENKVQLQNLERPQPRGPIIDIQSPADTDTDIPSSPTKPSRASTLLERTRQSMAALQISPELDESPLTNPRTTTRETQLQQKRKQNHQQHSYHPSYPTNQFQTPPLHRKHKSTLSLGGAQPETEPHSPSLPLPPIPATPSEGANSEDPATSPSQLLLFSEKADYDSVFKSRPRLAISPPPPDPSPSFLRG